MHIVGHRFLLRMTLVLCVLGCGKNTIEHDEWKAIRVTLDRGNSLVEVLPIVEYGYGNIMKWEDHVAYEPLKLLTGNTYFLERVVGRNIELDIGSTDLEANYGFSLLPPKEFTKFAHFTIMLDNIAEMGWAGKSIDFKRNFSLILADKLQKNASDLTVHHFNRENSRLYQSVSIIQTVPIGHQALVHMHIAQPALEMLGFAINSAKLKEKELLLIPAEYLLKKLEENKNVFIWPEEVDRKD